MKKLIIVLITVLSLSYACTKTNDPQPVKSKNNVAYVFDPYSIIDSWPTSSKLTLNWKNINNLSDNFKMNNAGDTLTLNNIKYRIVSHSPNYDYIDYQSGSTIVNLYVTVSTGSGRRLNTYYNYTYQHIKTYKL